MLFLQNHLFLVLVFTALLAGLTGLFLPAMLVTVADPPVGEARRSWVRDKGLR